MQCKRDQKERQIFQKLLEKMGAKALGKERKTRPSRSHQPAMSRIRSTRAQKRTRASISIRSNSTPEDEGGMVARDGSLEPHRPFTRTLTFLSTLRSSPVSLFLSFFFPFCFFFSFFRRGRRRRIRLATRREGGTLPSLNGSNGVTFDTADGRVGCISARPIYRRACSSGILAMAGWAHNPHQRTY